MPRRGPMTAGHKAAIRQGRMQANAVKAYLETLEVDRRRTSDPATVKKRLAAVETRLAGETNVLKGLELRQQRLDLQHILAAAKAEAQQKDLEKEFVKVASEFAQRKGIGYTAFREMGVRPKVLQSAGIKR
jgi:predicted transcriptional regulator with HTH domain